MGLLDDLSKLGSAMQSYGKATEDWLSGLGNDISDTAFRSWALSEARTAATIFMPLYERATGLSPLTSKMLTMYLNGKSADPALIGQVAAEIEQSATFGRLVGVVQQKVQAQVKLKKRPLTQAELDAFARTIVNKNYRDPTTAKAMYFLNSDRGLQGVIGGIHDLKVLKTEVKGTAYTITVGVVDAYDFDNNQNVAGNADLAKYVAFRQQLSDYIKAKQYREFLWDYHKSLYLADPIARARTFAAFMFAIERNGFTPGGVSWEAKVPLRGTM